MAKLLGHTSSALVENRYGHLLDDVRGRSEFIEYRAEHFLHRPEFHARLTAVYENAGVETVAGAVRPREIPVPTIETPSEEGESC